MKLFGLNISRASRSNAPDAASSLTAKAVDPNAWLTGADITDAGEGAKLTTPYAQSAWVYIAISTLAQSVSQIPFRFARLSAKAKKEIAGYF